MTPIHNSYTLRSLVCGVALVYVIRLGGATLDVLDTAALAFVIALLVYQLIGLTQRLSLAEAGLGHWSIPRNLLFWTVGLMNTLWLDPGVAPQFPPLGGHGISWSSPHRKSSCCTAWSAAWLNKRK